MIIQIDSREKARAIKKIVAEFDQQGVSHPMGYIKEYAPHVEYGHRTINGGWVPGQRFLKANADAQALIYYQDLLKAIKKG